MLLLQTPGPEEALALVSVGRQAFTETFGSLYSAQDLQDFLAKDYDPAMVAHGLADPTLHWRVARLDGVMVGFVKWGVCKLPLEPIALPQMELHRLYVLQAFQGKAIGRALMHAAMAGMQASGAGEICLGVWENNMKARRFYAAYGFEKAGEYDYPVGKQIDREWIMRKILAAKTLDAAG